ncbi:anti-sigma B factor antagonist [Blastococcus colisei]|uniref:Anti-sigma B factor antagonist n=1 Tax=Blastococcus colisei TaxID=1564162 RepID=A0A543PJB1_9ACTN|nr:STAS domain-containing protein [Blastococcus colisei]TQN44160.1 anti-sigma B factor antagonist [Blastococcus colisei]
MTLANSPQPPGRISLDCENGRRVIRLAGEIDTSTIDAFEAAHRLQLTEDNAPLRADEAISMVDLADVSFLSSTGISFLVRHTRAAREHGHRPALRGLHDPARRVLQITGVDSLFHVT